MAARPLRTKYERVIRQVVRNSEESYDSARRTGGTVQHHISNELQVLETLRAVGCSQIPGEALNVISMIHERKEVLRNLKVL
jgi:hypothetical protein